jgi:hypothetical protein
MNPWNDIADAAAVSLPLPCMTPATAARSKTVEPTPWQTLTGQTAKSMTINEIPGELSEASVREPSRRDKTVSPKGLTSSAQGGLRP